MKVRLLRKYARVINGVDLSTHNVGDVLELTPQQGNLLIAEGWASQVDERRRSVRERLSKAADALRRRSKENDVP